MSEAYGEWLVRNNHPFLNHMVLDKVFEHLSAKDLMECRLVCKTWNELTIPFTRRNVSRVVIHGNESTKIHTIGKFVEIFRSSSFGIPFSRFTLGSFCTTEGVGQEFLQLCGNVITKIDFLEESFYCVEDVAKILKSTPKLKTFTIPPHLQSRSGNIVRLFPDPNSKPRLMSLEKFTVLYDHPVERNKVCPTFIEELITTAENISSLKLWDSIGYSMGCTLEALRVIETLGRESKIVKLDISPNTSIDTVFVLLQRMAGKGLKLKKFEYREGHAIRNSDNQTLLQLLSFFENTLQVLEISDDCITSLMGFPKLPCLTHLNIGSEKKFNLKLGNLNKIFPILEQLVFFMTTIDSDYEMDDFFPDSDICPTMKTLIHISINIHFNTKTLNQMINIFPNLTYLKIFIREACADGVGQIWLRMTQLKYLSLSGTVQTEESLDCVITGISTLALQQIRDDDFVNKMGEMTTEIERRKEILKLRTQHSPMQHPSIANLTNLNSLTLKLTGNGIDGNGETSRLSDLSGYLGFYSMERLKHLTVRNCELTESCCEMLTTDMGLQSALFRNEKNQDIIPSVEY